MLLKFPVAALERIPGKDPELKHAEDVKWFALEAARRLHELQNAIVRFVPWMLPDFAELRKDTAIALPGPDIALKDLPSMNDRLAAKLQAAVDASSSEDIPSARTALIQRLLAMVSGASLDAARQIQELEALASDAERLADETEFAFLWNPRQADVDWNGNRKRRSPFSVL